MATHWDHQTSRPILPILNGHGRTASFQLPLDESLNNTRPSILPLSEHHGLATPFSPLFAENNIIPIPLYEAYTIRPDNFASSEYRWSLPLKDPLPVTQESLHTEVISQRQSGRTACRELEDCHGPKRQYIDRLISERNASTALGYFEVAQLRLERIPKDSVKGSNRNGRSYHARSYKQKDSTKPRQKTLSMHIILQFVKNPSRSCAEIPPSNLTTHDMDSRNEQHIALARTTDEDSFIVPMSSNDQSHILPGTSNRPVLARGHSYRAGNEQATSFIPSRYISQGTQTTLSMSPRPHSDWCSDENDNDATLGNASLGDNWTTAASSVEEETLMLSSSSDDEVISMGDSAAAHEFPDGSTEEELKGIDEYEKPPWFQNLQPGLLLLRCLSWNLE